MKSKKILVLLLSVIAISTVLFTGFLLWKYNDSFDLGGEVAELDSIYISDTDNAQLQAQQNEPLDINEDVNPSKVGELSRNENRKVIQFSQELSEDEKEQLEEEYNIQFTNDQSVNGTYSVITQEDSDVTKLQEDERVSTVETDIPIKMFEDTIDWGVTRVGANQVWQEGSGSGVTVAIIDTGIQLSHPDLGSNIVSGYDFVNSDSSANDDNGHGTHVAGIVASTLNGSGNVGTSHSARLMPVKVLNESGYGYLSDITKGIYYAADNGARVINLSLGTSYDSSTLKNAVDYAARKGVLLVGAAGNDSGSPCSYPAAYSSVICVVATDQNNKLASFSNIGGELAAPGVSNYSTYINSSYARLSGTSMASPHVAGSGALVMSVCTECTTPEVRNILRDNTTDLGAVDYDIIFGYGLVNLVDAIESILPEEKPEEENTEEIVEQQPTEDEEDYTEEVSKEKELNTKPNKPLTPETIYTLSITSPEINASKRYSPKTREDINIEFKVSPSDGSIISYEILLNNEEIEDYDGNEPKYTLSIEELSGIQHTLTVKAYLDDGTQISDRFLLNLIHLSSRGRSVRGIADFRNWFTNYFFN